MSNASRMGSGKRLLPKVSGRRTRSVIAQESELSEVFDLIDQNRLVSDLSTMIEIPSVNPVDDEARPGFREQELGEFYLERMSQLGMEVGSRDVVPGRPNVWGVLKGKGNAPSLMLSGHLDTVGTENYPTALKAVITDNRVYGRGSCDMKAGLAAYLEVVRLVNETGSRLEGDLMITGIADEEHLMIGSRDLGQHGPWADYGLIGEPTDMIICPAHKGQLGFIIRTFGDAVHTSQPEKGTNAINSMAKVIETFHTYGEELMGRDAHQLCGHARSCPSVIRGGTVLSTVPDYCELEIDRRTLPGETQETVLREYHKILDDLAVTLPGFKYEIAGPTLNVAPLNIPMDSPIVQASEKAYERVFGEEGTISAFIAGTDAPNLGFPTVVCGPGSIEQAHTTNEYVEIEDIASVTRLYLCTVLDLLNRPVAKVW